MCLLFVLYKKYMCVAQKRLRVQQNLIETYSSAGCISSVNWIASLLIGWKHPLNNIYNILSHAVLLHETINTYGAQWVPQLGY